MSPSGFSCCPFLGGDSVVVGSFFANDSTVCGLCVVSLFCTLGLNGDFLRFAIIFLRKRELVALL